MEVFGNCLRVLAVGGPTFFEVSKSSMSARSLTISGTSVLAFLSLCFFKLYQSLSCLLS